MHCHLSSAGIGHATPVWVKSAFIAARLCGGEFNQADTAVSGVRPSVVMFSAPFRACIHPFGNVGRADGVTNIC